MPLVKKKRAPLCDAPQRFRPPGSPALSAPSRPIQATNVDILKQVSYPSGITAYGLFRATATDKL